MGRFRTRPRAPSPAQNCARTVVECVRRSPDALLFVPHGCAEPPGDVYKPSALQFRTGVLPAVRERPEAPQPPDYRPFGLGGMGPHGSPMPRGDPVCAKMLTSRLTRGKPLFHALGARPRPRSYERSLFSTGTTGWIRPVPGKLFARG